MPAPTTALFLNTTAPGAPDGNQPIVFQSDGGTPEQSVTAYPQIATTDAAGVVIPDGTSITIDPTTGIISADSSGVAGSVQQGEYIFAIDTGAANAYEVTQTPAPIIVQGSMVAMQAANANTGPSTLSVNGGDAAPITDDGEDALVGGEINAGQIIVLMFDGANFQIVGGNSGGSSSGAPLPVVPSGTIDGSNVSFTIPAAGGGNLYVNGILQNPFGSSPDYVISGTGITMAAAPNAGTQPDWLLWVYLAGDPGPTGPAGPTGGVSTIGVVIDGGGSVPATGAKGVVQVPYAGTITGWTMLADQSGSAQITVSKGSYAGFPTVSSIDASAPPSLSSAQKATSTTLTGWTTSISAGDVLSFNLDSVTSCERIILELQVTRT